MRLSQAWAALCTFHLGSAKEVYSEHLEIQPFSRNVVLSTFNFELSQPVSVDEELGLHEYTTFPRSLGQILERSNTKELHLRFGQGWWDAEAWGSPPANGTQAGGIGVEVWAWIGGQDMEEVWSNWRRLVHSLGGYFCASINFIDETQTNFPLESILPPQSPNLEGAVLLRGTLPAEPICTENLTPFLKLLPCQGKAGIASLLDGHTLFRSLWQTMSVDVWKSDSDTLNLKQTVANVVNTDRCVSDPLPWFIPADKLTCDKSKPWANDWTCFPASQKDANFSLSQIFGKPIQGHCALAATDEPTIKVKAPENWLVNNSSGSREFTLKEDPGYELELTFAAEDGTQVYERTKPLLYVERSFSGWGQQNGGIRTIFTNPEPVPISVHYLESLPWFMRLYLHTTKTRGNGSIAYTSYIPSKDRGRPSQLELQIEFPPNGKFEIEYDFDKSLLYIEEYPPDANHGFEVPPGLAVADTPYGRYEVRTSSLLLSLPVPDFSMPYNVIILTSTVIALAFGTIYNLAVREVVEATETPAASSEKTSRKAKLLSLLKFRF